MDRREEEQVATCRKAFADKPNQAQLSSEFVAKANEALVALSHISMTADGFDGIELAEKTTDSLPKDTTGELVMWITMTHARFQIMKDMSREGRNGTLAPVSPRLVAQEEACRMQLNGILTQATVPADINECRGSKFRAIKDN